MFESLRKNIQSVQEGITAGLQRLSVTGGSSSVTTGGGGPASSDGAQLLGGGGADLLTMYQSHWATMHHMAEQNAVLAQSVANSISAVTEECESQHSQLLEVRSLLAHLPNIMAQLHSSLHTIGSVRGLLEEVEVGLQLLDDTMDEAAVQDQLLDLRLSCALRTEHRQHRLNMLHNELTAVHGERVAAAVAVAATMAEGRRRRERERGLTNQDRDHKLSSAIVVGGGEGGDSGGGAAGKGHEDSGRDAAGGEAEDGVGGRVRGGVLKDVVVETDEEALEAFLGDEAPS